MNHSIGSLSLQPLGPRTLYLHIGMEKTGSTSLQLFLHENASKLSQQGIWYPTDEKYSFVERFAHFPVAACLISAEVGFISEAKISQKAECLSDLLAEQQARLEPITILSAEHFSSSVTDRSALVAFRDQLHTCYHAIIIIVYVRNQPSLAKSAYSTKVMTGRRERFSLEEITNDPYFDILRMLNLWSGVFGETNVIACEFNNEKFLDGDICSDFCNLIQIRHGDLCRVPSQNVSLTDEKIEVIRFINHYLSTFEEDPVAWRAAHNLRYNYILPSLTSIPNWELYVSESNKEYILQRFDIENRILNTKYLKGSLSGDWFSEHKQEACSLIEFKGIDLDETLASSLVSLAEKLSNSDEECEQLSREVMNLNKEIEIMQNDLECAQQQLEDSRKHLESAQRSLERIVSTRLWKLREALLKIGRKVQMLLGL
jgi:hypothetical protein